MARAAEVSARERLGEHIRGDARKVIAFRQSHAYGQRAIAAHIGGDPPVRLPIQRRANVQPCGEPRVCRRAPQGRLLGAGWLVGIVHAADDGIARGATQ